MKEMVEIVGNLCELEGVAKVNQSFFLNFMKNETDSCPDVEFVKDYNFFKFYPRKTFVTNSMSVHANGVNVCR